MIQSKIFKVLFCFLSFWWCSLEKCTAVQIILAAVTLLLFFLGCATLDDEAAGFEDSGDDGRS